SDAEKKIAIRRVSPGVDVTPAQSSARLMSPSPTHRSPILSVVEGELTAPSVSEADWSMLMERAQGGDTVAYRRLLEEIAPYVRSLAAKWCREPDEVEEIVQDTLLTIHAIRQTYDPVRPFGPWLVAITKRRLADRLRRNSLQRQRETPLTGEHETFPVTQANNSADATERRALGLAINQLPIGQRQAIELLKLKEMSLKEAAATTGMSIAALKVATHRLESSAEIARRRRSAMIPTCDLIDLLANRLTPVRRLRGPMTRAAQWLLLASIVTMIVVVAHGVRP